MDTNQLITLRRGEVERELEQISARMATLREELMDLSVAERVLRGLTGAGSATASAPDKPKPKNATEARAAGAPPMPEMIFGVLEEAFHQGRNGLEPREVADAIDAHPGWGPINRDVIRTRLWRLARDGKLFKAENSAVYGLMVPPNEKPASAQSGQDTPAGLFPDQQQSREAETGGGT